MWRNRLFLGVLLTAVAMALTLFGLRTSGWRRHTSIEASRAGRERPAAAPSNNFPPPLPTLTGTTFLSDSGRTEPSDDQWPSEVFASAAEAQLRRLMATAVEGGWRPQELAGQFAADFQLLAAPGEPTRIFADSSIVVDRWHGIELAEPLRDAAAIDQFVKSLSVAPQPGGRIELLLKIVRVELAPHFVSTTLRAESSCESPEGATQKTSLWDCQWTRDDESPRIRRAKLQTLDQVQRVGPRWLDDTTFAVIGDSAAFQQQLAYGLQHWLARIETAHGMNYFSKHGLAVADINGDGLEDVYVCQPGGLPNRLFVQQADGSAREQAADYGLDLLDRTSSALFVDLDNDGDQDAALATIMGVLIYEQLTEGRFQQRQVIPFADIDLQGLSAADYDGDGDLDLYQAVDFASEDTRARQGLPAFLYHDARDGGENRLLRNDFRPGPSSSLHFTDVTRDVGLAVNNHRHTLAAAWEDYDNDGDQDLYVANDYGPNSLYRNDGGRFVDVAQQAGVVDFGSGMSVSWGDYDRDGRMDLYVGNMFSSAGSRITSQNRFLAGVGQQQRQLYRRFAKGNTLFRNLGDRFEDVGASAGVEMGRWAWSSLFCDFNLDGWDDLLVANGYITTADGGDL